jgi:hypothetical protein
MRGTKYPLNIQHRMHSHAKHGRKNSFIWVLRYFLLPCFYYHEAHEGSEEKAMRVVFNETKCSIFKSFMRFMVKTDNIFIYFTFNHALEPKIIDEVQL